MQKEELPLNKTFNIKLRYNERKTFNVPHGKMWKIHSCSLENAEIKFKTKEDAVKWNFFCSFGQDPYSDQGTWIPQDISFCIKNKHVNGNITIKIDELFTQDNIKKI